jgi:hypothetical protein
VFAIIIAEDWNSIFLDYANAQDPDKRNMPMAYFLPVLAIGNFMLLSLFTTILLETFNSELEEK